MRSSFLWALALGMHAAVCLDCQAQPDPAREGREAARFVATGSARGMTVPALVAAQHQKALANWKKIFSKDTPDSLETDHFLLYGTVKEKPQAEIATSLEKAFALAQKTLDMESDEPWPGKMAIYFFDERPLYNSMVRIMEKRKTEEDEGGCFEIDSEYPHAIVGPTESKVVLSAVGQAGEQAAGALLYRKTRGANVPPWMFGAFGRATVFRAGPAKDLAQEHGRAVLLVGKKKATLKTVLGSGATVDQTVVLQASFIEYMAYSGKTTKFFPMLNGFRPTEQVQEPTIEQALMSVNLSVDRVGQLWSAWVIFQR